MFDAWGGTATTPTLEVTVTTRAGTRGGMYGGVLTRLHDLGVDYTVPQTRHRAHIWPGLEAGVGEGAPTDP